MPNWPKSLEAARCGVAENIHRAEVAMHVYDLDATAETVNARKYLFSFNKTLTMLLQMLTDRFSCVVKSLRSIWRPRKVPITPSRTCCVHVDQKVRKFSREKNGARVFIGSAPAIKHADDMKRVWRIERCENSVSKFYKCYESIDNF